MLVVILVTVLNGYLGSIISFIIITSYLNDPMGPDHCHILVSNKVVSRLLAFDEIPRTSFSDAIFFYWRKHPKLLKKNHFFPFPRKRQKLASARWKKRTCTPFLIRLVLAHAFNLTD